MHVIVLTIKEITKENRHCIIINTSMYLQYQDYNYMHAGTHALLQNNDTSRWVN